MIRNDLDTQQKQLTSALAFCKKYGKALGKDEQAFLSSHICLLSDAALAGDVLGKDNWKRKVNYDATIQWVRKVNGVDVVIERAEEIAINNSPVSPSAFPLQLTDATN